MSIFNYKIHVKENGNWEPWNRWQRPFVDCETLDESLDYGEIKVVGVPRKESYKPFTPIRFSVYEINGNGNVEQMSNEECKPYLVGTYYRLVSDSAVQQITFRTNISNPNLLYTHTIKFIELTKLLEREICDSLTFTKYLGHDYLNGATIVMPNLDAGIEDDNEWITKGYPYCSPVLNGSTTRIVSLKDSGINYKDHSTLFTRFTWDKANSYTVVSSDSLGEMTLAYSENKNVTIPTDEIITIKYCLLISTGNLGQYISKVIYEISSVANITPKEPLSITDVIDRILLVGKTIRKGVEKQRFVLDPKIAEKYSAISSPEFHITRSTMFEALAQIGAYVHAIPRLIWNSEIDEPNIITFDELGGNNEYFLPSGITIAAYSQSQSIDEFCGCIDSTVENLLNTKNKEQGSVTEPFANGYKTIRTEESGVEISSSTAIIHVEKPIYRIEKVIVKNFKNGEESNITQYIFEAAEYGVLSSYTGAYPYSKGYALRYAQGDNKITELNFKIESITSVGSAMKNPVMYNILKQLGKTCPVDYNELGFRVTYIPMVNSRVIQKKSHVDSSRNNLVLLYNQISNTVESDSYGENLKGTIARLGNGEETETYFLKKWQQLPKCGQLFKGKYISRVMLEPQLNWLKVSIVLSENFNQLAKYLGINTNYRLYDVSEKQSVDRQINYSEDVIIGDAIDNETSLSGITSFGIDCFSKVFSQNAGDKSVTMALVEGISSQGLSISKNILSSTSFALGNALTFGWEYEDSFSAGYQSCKGDDLKRVQQLVPYGDVYGEYYYLNLVLSSQISSSNIDLDFAHALPNVANTLSVDQPLFSYSGNNPLIIVKDSRERISVTTQLNMVCNRKSIVVGSALTHNNPLVTTSVENKNAALYFFNEPINILNSFVRLDGSHNVSNFNSENHVSLDKIKKTMTLSSFLNNTLKTFKSWALVEKIYDSSNAFTGWGRIYIGENMVIEPSGKTRTIKFTFRSNKE